MALDRINRPKEGTMLFEQALVTGLRADNRQQRNAQALVTLNGLIPTQFGLKQLETATYPIVTPALADILAWPFPQLMRCDDEDHLLLFRATTIYDVVESTWTATAISNFYLADDPMTETCANPGFTGGSTSWTLNAGWTYASNAVTKAAGNTNTLVQVYGSQASPLASAQLYQVKVVVTAMTAGQITVDLGGSAGAAITAAGTYWQYIIASGATPSVTITPTTTFDGTVTEVSCQILTVQALQGSAWWSLASFGSSWFATNATTLAFLMPSNPNSLHMAVYDAGSEFRCNCVANHQNRLLIGGPNGYFGSGTTWANVFNAWKDSAPEWLVVDENEAVANNWVIYSEEAGGDIDTPYVYLLAALGYPGARLFDRLQEIILHSVEQREMGMLPCRNTGEILCIKPLGDNAIVYGRKGISQLIWTDQGYREMSLLDVGIGSRSGVGGDEVEHVFVDSQEQLYRLTLTDGLQRLDYEEFIDGLTAATTVVAFDPEQRYYWISDGTTGYCLTRTGLGGCTDVQPITLLRSYNDTAAGLLGTYSPAVDPTNAATLTTEIFDGGERAVWEIVSVRLATTDTDTTGWQVQVDYRFDKSSAWTRSDAATCDARGIARVKVSGLEFRVYCTASDRTTVDLDRIEVAMRSGGKRSLRKWIDAA